MSHTDNDPKPESGRGDNEPEIRYVPMPMEYSQAYQDEQDEIDLIELAKTIWDNRTVIYKFMAVGIFLGAAVALLSSKEYKSSASLMPEYSTSSAGGGTASRLLQQYGGLLGISSGGTYNSASNAIRVQLYPQIVSSLSFQQKLASQPFYYSEYDTTATLMDYYLNIQTPGVMGYIRQYTIGLPGLILGAVFGSHKEIEKYNDPYANREIVEMSPAEVGVIENLRGRVTAALDEESGIVTVSVQMPDPKLAAEMADYTIEELTSYLVEYRIGKVMRDLEFVKDQLSQAEERFEAAQLALAEFRDRNQGTLTNRARTQEQQLQSEFDVAFNLYNGLTQEYEQAKLRVQEETPVFKVLNPVNVPVNDETSGVMILIVFVLLSGIASIGFIFIRQFLETNPFGEREK